MRMFEIAQALNMDRRRVRCAVKIMEAKGIVRCTMMSKRKTYVTLKPRAKRPTYNNPVARTNLVVGAGWLAALRNGEVVKHPRPQPATELERTWGWGA